MRLYWLEQAQEEVPARTDWLCPTELNCLNGFRFTKRRADWRLGRWTSERAVAAYLNWPTDAQVLARIEVHATPLGAPEVHVRSLGKPLALSLSHRAGRAMCVVSSAGSKLGCDLEVIEPRSDAFVADYFAPQERSPVANTASAERSTLVTLLWSAKESALKALGQGLRLDTCSVIVSPGEGAPDLSGWSPLVVRCVEGQIFHGWWRKQDDMVRTVLSDPAPECPIGLAASERAYVARDILDLSIENGQES